MYVKFDLSVYNVPCMWCWLHSNSLNPVIYQDLSSFQGYTELFHFPLMYIRKTTELKNFSKKVFWKFWYWNRGKVKAISVLGHKKLSNKKTCNVVYLTCGMMRRINVVHVHKYVRSYLLLPRLLKNQSMNVTSSVSVLMFNMQPQVPSTKLFLRQLIYESCIARAASDNVELSLLQIVTHAN